MKKLLLTLSLSLALTACGGSDNEPPEGAVGLWVDTIEAQTADRLGSFSLNNGECEAFQADSYLPEFTGTQIEDNGDMYLVTANQFGRFTDESITGSMNRDGDVQLNLPEDSVLELGVIPQIRFEMTGLDTALAVTTYDQGSLSIEQEFTELSKINESDFAYLADRVVRFCTR